jgi:hypothetical protein
MSLHQRSKLNSYFRGGYDPTWVIIPDLVTDHPSLNLLPHWIHVYKEWVPIILGGGGVAMGLLKLETQ